MIIYVKKYANPANLSDSYNEAERIVSRSAVICVNEEQ